MASSALSDGNGRKPMRGKNYEICIDMDVKCRRCKKPGATPGGYCLTCVAKNMDEGRYDHIFDAKGGAMKSAIGDSAARLAEIRALWDKILGVERELEILAETRKEKKEEREALLARVKETIYDPQARLGLE